MKGIRFLGNRQLEITDLPDPEVGKGEVLVKVKASAICGSELESFVLSTPLKGNPGHEVMGIIEIPTGQNVLKREIELVLQIYRDVVPVIGADRENKFFVKMQKD